MHHNVGKFPVICLQINFHSHSEPSFSFFAENLELATEVYVVWHFGTALYHSFWMYSILQVIVNLVVSTVVYKLLNSESSGFAGRYFVCSSTIQFDPFLVTAELLIGSLLLMSLDHLVSINQNKDMEKLLSLFTLAQLLMIKSILVMHIWYVFLFNCLKQCVFQTLYNTLLKQ